MGMWPTSGSRSDRLPRDRLPNVIAYWATVIGAILLGLVVGRWWVLVVPLIAGLVLVGVSGDCPDVDRCEIDGRGVAVAITGIAVALTAFGVGVRQLAGRRRHSRSGAP